MGVIVVDLWWICGGFAVDVYRQTFDRVMSV